MGNIHSSDVTGVTSARQPLQNLVPGGPQGYMETAHGCAWLSCWCI